MFSAYFNMLAMIAYQNNLWPTQIQFDRITSLIIEMVYSL